MPKCIFCGGKDLNGEHLWSAWTHQYIKPTGTTSRLLHSTALVDRTDYRIDRRSGDLRHRTVTCVCKLACNNGWMKRLEDKVKPIARPLVLGERCRLFPHEQRTLAAWLSLKAIIGEYAGMERTTTKAQRDRMWKEQLPPAEGWTVWIGDLEPGRYRALWVSNPFPISDDPNKTGERASPNSCASTQVIGRLFAHVLRSVDHELVRTWHFSNAARRSLRSIWPPGDTSLGAVYKAIDG